MTSVAEYFHKLGYQMGRMKKAMTELENLLSAAVECGDEAALKAFTKANERAYSKLAQIERERKRVEEQKLTGRMFKKQETIPYDCWKYAVVIGLIKDPDGSEFLDAFSFKCDSLNNIEISYREYFYIGKEEDMPNWIEIDAIEFDLAWRELIKALPDNPRMLVKK